MTSKLTGALTGLALAVVTLAAAGADSPEATIRKTLAARLPELKIDAVSAAPIAGLYELRVGTEIYYADERGEHLVQGNIIDTRTRTDLTQARIDQVNAIDIGALPLQDAIVWKQGSGARRMVVFADPNCGYCKRFETDLRQVKDVTVYTFLLPILGGDSTEKARNIWCAKNNAAVWRGWMIEGATIPRNMGPCDSSALERNVALGKKYRVNGTPAIVFEDGKRVPGALAPADVEKQLAASRRKG